MTKEMVRLQCSRTNRSIAKIHNRFHQNGSEVAQNVLKRCRIALEIDFGVYFRDRAPKSSRALSYCMLLFIFVAFSTVTAVSI